MEKVLVRQYFFGSLRVKTGKRSTQEETDCYQYQTDYVRIKQCHTKQLVLGKMNVVMREVIADRRLESIEWMVPLLKGPCFSQMT